MRRFIVFIFIMLAIPAQARLLLDVSILNKKGIDIGLTLGSELHSIEEVRTNKPIQLKMRSGIKVILNASFIEVFEKLEEKDLYGPLSKVKVTGRILNSQNVVIKDFEQEPLLIDLEEKKKIIHSQSSQLVEIILKPHLK